MTAPLAHRIHVHCAGSPGRTFTTLEVARVLLPSYHPIDGGEHARRAVRGSPQLFEWLGERQFRARGTDLLIESIPPGEK